MPTDEEKAGEGDGSGTPEVPVEARPVTPDEEKMPPQGPELNAQKEVS